MSGDVINACDLQKSKVRDTRAFEKRAGHAAAFTACASPCRAHRSGTPKISLARARLSSWLPATEHAC
jgi:hypothetical protein